MSRSSLHVFGPSAAAIVLLTTSIAGAQQAGTNAATPPAPTATVVSGNTATTPQIVPLGDSNEPVIDATSTKTTFINRPLMVTGLIFLAGSYGTAAIIGATSDKTSDEKLFIPVAGPWLDMKDRNCDVNVCTNEGAATAGLIVDGVFQGLGALAILTSFVIPEKTTHKWMLIGSEKLTIAPSQVGRSGYGLGAVGFF